ncbi:MAG: flagellar hook-associated protein FlgK [Gammaproteobacteria bacterium]|nr:flagellar hook-associated protein FlgK [Gammaproteobacteria bacterium]MDH5693480.1 flagellar hook-associated protein FlgK [Gammaproteobacteria bacterium]
MPSGDAFQIGRSGLISFQRNLATISHNISNVNTEGYSRQRVLLATRYPSPSGAGFVGNGVYAVDTQRLFDEHAIKQVQLRTTSSFYFNEFRAFAEQIDNLLADPDAGLSPALRDFFDSAAVVADDPTSSAAREGMLSYANSLVDRVHTIDDWLNDLRISANEKVTDVTIQINTYANTIAELNHDIVVARGSTGDSNPNDLLDQRDEVIRKLSELVSVTTLEQDDGMVNIFIGSGQSLVLGTYASKLMARPIPDDPTLTGIYYEIRNSGGTLVNITDYVTGGELAGVLDFRDDVLVESMNHLGRLTTALTMTFNAQHRVGMDLNNAIGGNFFVPEQVFTATEAATNPAASPATVTGRFFDPTQITTDEYRLTYDGPNYTLTNLSSGVKTTLVPAGGGPFTLGPITDGFEITVDVLPNVGDSFYIRPTRNATRFFDVNITEGNEIAASGLLRSNANLNNLGTAAIGEVTVTDITDLNLLNTVVIDFRNPAGGPGPATEMRVNGGAWVAYGGSATVAINGWTTDISGQAWDGDSFTVEHNIGGVSDNRNALALTELQNVGILNNGTTTYQDAYSELVVLVGNQTQQSILNANAQEAMLQQAIEHRESISGVNLDEEAADMLRYQQAYAAAAQVIATADSLFQELLSAVRR